MQLRLMLATAVLVVALAGLTEGTLCGQLQAQLCAPPSSKSKPVSEKALVAGRLGDREQMATIGVTASTSLPTASISIIQSYPGQPYTVWSTTAFRRGPEVTICCAEYWFMFIDPAGAFNCHVDINLVTNDNGFRTNINSQFANGRYTGSSTVYGGTSNSLWSLEFNTTHFGTMVYGSSVCSEEAQTCHQNDQSSEKF